MINLKAVLLFALLTLNAAAANIYDIAVLYNLDILEEFENGTVVYADCSQDNLRMQDLTVKAFQKIELFSKQRNDERWESLQVIDDEHIFRIEADDQGKVFVENVADQLDGGRKLQFNKKKEKKRPMPAKAMSASAHCNSFCRFMCNSQGTYCSCCACCGNGRRRLGRTLQVKVIDNSREELDKLETAAEDAVYEELEKTGISCLAGPVDVKLMPQDGTTTWEEREKERKDWRKKHQADRRAKRRARKILGAALEVQRKVQGKLERALEELKVATIGLKKAEKWLTEVGKLDEKLQQKEEVLVQEAQEDLSKIGKLDAASLELEPESEPVQLPSGTPSASPTSKSPTSGPTSSPSASSGTPSASPSKSPTSGPTSSPSASPSASSGTPSASPTSELEPCKCRCTLDDAEDGDLNEGVSIIYTDHQTIAEKGLFVCETSQIAEEARSAHTAVCDDAAC